MLLAKFANFLVRLQVITLRQFHRALRGIVLAAALLIGVSCSPKGSFYSVKDGQIVLGDAPQYYVGANFWYGPMLASSEPGLVRLRAELDTLNSLGIRNLRVLPMADGPDGPGAKVQPAGHIEPGVYLDAQLRGMDIFMQEIEKRGMSAVIYLNNAWEWSGGYGTYLEWAGEGKTPDTRTDGYVAYMNFVSKFITSPKAQELFFDHVRFMVERYKDSPAVFSWQIANEPRCFSSDPAVQDAFVDFVHNTASLIKSIDPHHMVSTGNEGSWGCEGSMELCERINDCKDIDYVTIHIWPYNWSWVKEDKIASGVQTAIDNTSDYIDEHVALAAKMGKPLVIEEFGYPRDAFAFEKGTPVSGRDAYYSYLLDRLCKSAADGGAFAGLNFWGWGGMAAQTPGHTWWEQGDDYCGDPAQEQQGLNSVYLSDTSTVKLLSETANKLNINN